MPWLFIARGRMPGDKYAATRLAEQFTERGDDGQLLALAGAGDGDAASLLALGAAAASAVGFGRQESRARGRSRSPVRPGGGPPARRFRRSRKRATMRVVRYKAVLCDIDGVLRHWPSLDDLELAHGLSPGTLAAAAFAPGRLIPAITGQITDEQWRARTEAAIAGKCGSRATARSVVAAWSSQLPAVDTEVVALLREARRSAPVALVSNATTRLERDLQRQGLDGLADAVVNTSRIGDPGGLFG